MDHLHKVKMFKTHFYAQGTELCVSKQQLVHYQSHSVTMLNFPQCFVGNNVPLLLVVFLHGCISQRSLCLYYVCTAWVGMLTCKSMSASMNIYMLGKMLTWCMSHIHDQHVCGSLHQTQVFVLLNYSIPSSNLRGFLASCCLFLISIVHKIKCGRYF